MLWGKIYPSLILFVKQTKLKGLKKVTPAAKNIKSACKKIEILFSYSVVVGNKIKIIIE
jgi:hypothetical protein